MKKEFINAIIQEIEKNSIEKDIPKQSIIEFLVEAIKKIYFRRFQADNLEVIFDLENKVFETYRLLTIVEDSLADTYDDFTEILESDPEVKSKGLKVGDIYKQYFDIQSFKRADVLLILQSFKQKIVDAVNSKVYVSWKPFVGKIVLGKIEKQDPKSLGYYVELPGGINGIATLAFVPKKESNLLENLKIGRTYPFYVKNVVEKSNFWPVVLSRNSEKLVEHYLTDQIPEIEQDLIQIVSCARIAGYRTKVLVKSSSPSITEPISICIGVKGSKIKQVSDLIGGEKIDIYKYEDNPIKTLINVIGKDLILGLIPKYNEDNKLVSCIVYMQNENIQIALGKSGNNAKLCSKLLNIYLEIDNIEYYDSDPNFIDKNEINELLSKNDDPIIDDSEIIEYTNIETLDDLINDDEILDILNNHEEDKN